MASSGGNTVEAQPQPGDKKVVLFGKTGEGKSTIANVLVTGGISETVVFKSSDAARGCTERIMRDRGRGWFVIDTVGLGEAEMGNTSHAEAQKLVTDFLKEFKGDYSHIIYVQKARRITTMEELIWKLFAQIFKGAEGAFVVVITSASQLWYEENKDKFPSYWTEENVKILYTDIPPEHKRPVLERKLKPKRKAAIAKLEADLQEFFEENKQKGGDGYFTPDIAKMDERQLENKSKSLLDYIVEQIKKLFDRGNWESVAKRLSTVIQVTERILDIILLADAVRD
ncbi:unnamed protein product [Calypogeia fissa]